MKQTTTSDPSGGTTLPWPHHPALDGLRTVAVYLVVLFHCGVSGFDGGFLGVDLFFVLSGFLVSSILLDEAERTGRVRLGRFYGRRVRRLLPAAVVVVIATSGLSLLLSPLVARLPWIGDAQASLLYVSNWRFLEQSNDYFGADINRSPFLHFWSLSVEEQFYFALPLILLLLFQLRRRWRPALVTGVAVLTGLSVANQLYWAGRDATHAYYGTDARIYQLLVGVLAAVAWRRYQSRGVRARGAGWVFLAILLLTASSLAPFSVSWRGLLATGASVGLTLAVVARTDRSLVAALSRPTMTYLGQISYGTYLWHWPAVLAIGLLVDVRPWVLTVLVVAVATGLASASYELLEMPIRRSPRLAPFGLSTLVVGVACSMLVAATVVPLVLERNRLPTVRASGAVIAGASANRDRLVPRDIDWQRYRDDMGAGTHFCTKDDETSCISYQGHSGLHVAVIGDSHARQLAAAMIRLAREHDFTLSLDVSGNCPWQLGAIAPKKTTDGGPEECLSTRKDLYGSVLKDMGVDVVVLSQNARERPDQIRAPDGSKVGVPELIDGQKRTINRLRTQGIKVVIVESFLQISAKGRDHFNPLECLSGARHVSECRVPVPTEPPIFDAYYRVLAMADPDVATVDINPVMCPAWPICDALDGRIPVWRDGGHYSADDLIKHRKEIWDLLRGSGFFDAAS